MLHTIVAFFIGLLGLGGTNVGAVAPLQLQQGGLGTSTVAANYVLIGLNTGRVTAVSTSSLGITTTGDGTFSTTSASYFSSVGLAYSTTSTLADLTAYDKGFFFSTTSALAHLTSIDKGFFFSTTSASDFASNGLAFSTTSNNYFTSVGLSFSTTSSDYWKTQNNFFSTTSANYWSSVGLGFSTTSATYFLNSTTSTGFSTTSANYYVHSSTTIPKTYTANTYSLTQTFTLAPIFTALSGIVKGNGASAATVAVDGTDFTLIDVSTCSAGLAHVSVTAAGVFTCGTAFSTTSAQYFTSVGLTFSTTSANYWASVGLAHSTTSSDYWLTQRQGAAFSTTSANYWSTFGLGHSTTSVAYQLTQNVTLGNATATNFFATLSSSTNAFALNGTTTKFASVFASLTNATTTYLAVTSVASTSKLYADGLTSCNGSSNALTWSGGTFGCNSITGGGGNMSGWATSTTAWSQLILYPVNGSEDVVFGGTGSGATTSAPFWWDVSATTSYIGNGGAGDSSITFGPNGSQFSIGFYNTDTTYRISRGTSLGTDNLLAIKRSTGTLGIGSSTPWGLFSVSSTTLGITGYTVAIASNGYYDFFAHSTTTGPRPGPRVSIGTSSRSYIGDRWALTVNGPMYSTWDMLQCNRINAMANLTADSTFNQVCGDFLFDEDAQGATSVASTTPSGIPYLSVWAGATAVRTAITASGDGAAILPIGTGTTGLFTSSSTPAMEVWVQASSTNSSSTIYMVGFWQGAFGSDFAPSDATINTTHGFGLVGTSSNWMAVVKNGSTAAQYSDTGVATSTATSDYTYQKINIDVLQLTADTYRVYFDINDVTRTWIDMSAGSGMRQLVNPRISVGARAAGNAKNIRVLQPIRVYQKMIQY